MNKFAIRLKELREQSKLTQEQLAQKMQISRSAIGMYERGKREPDFEFIEKCASLFGVSMDYLLGNDTETDGYYENPETARIAQQMFDDPQMRSLFHMKRTMDPESFQAHYEMLKKMYLLEHPEDADDFAGC